MTRIRLLLFLTLVAFASDASTLHTEHDRLFAALEKAQQAQDWQSAHENLVKLDELLHGPSFAKWALAMTDFRLKRKDEGIAALQAYAAMGLTREPSSSPALDAVKDDPAIKKILLELAANASPIHSARILYTLPEHDLITEDVAWDPRSKRIFVSSVRQRKIVTIGPDGAVSDFIRSGQDYVDAILALRIDPSGHWLWATTARMPQQIGYKESPTGRTALLKYDLRSGALLTRIDLPCRTKQCVLGDMTISRNGDIFVSESVNGFVYRMPREGSALEALTPPGALVSPQTPALVNGDRILLVADYSAGIARIELKKGKMSWIEHPPNVALDGIDGLYSTGHDLLAVQNGTNPSRVLRLSMDPEWKKVTGSAVLESNSPELGSPTHGVFAGKEFYFIGQSGWDSMSDEGPPKAGAAFQAPLVLSLELDAPGKPKR